MTKRKKKFGPFYRKGEISTICIHCGTTVHPISMAEVNANICTNCKAKNIIATLLKRKIQNA